MNKIWSGGLCEDNGPDLSSVMTRDDIGVDALLIKYEILSLLAIHLEVARMRIIAEQDSREIIKGLLILYRGDNRLEHDYEDVHSFVESKLMGITVSAADLRIFISRNEQSHFNVRSFYIDLLLDLAEKTLKVAAVAYLLAHKYEGCLPGYTHSRQAMPVSAGTYFDYLSESFLDISRNALSLSEEMSSKCPIGYGSGFGSMLSVDYNKIAESLGFQSSYLNPMHGASKRGIDDLEVLFLEIKLMTNVSRISQDLMNFSSDELAFIKLPSGYSTGSSLMPNKRNPDFLEMLQGYCSETLGRLCSSVSILLNKSSGYHREFQISKDSTVLLSNRILTLIENFGGLLEAIDFDREKAKDILQNTTYATVEAYHRFLSGKKWKEAYADVAKDLRKGEEINEWAPVTYLSVNEETITEMEEKIQLKKRIRQRLFQSIVDESDKFISA